jgi:hypothetical protein
MMLRTPDQMMDVPRHLIVSLSELECGVRGEFDGRHQQYVMQNAVPQFHFTVTDKVHRQFVAEERRLIRLRANEPYTARFQNVAVPSQWVRQVHDDVVADCKDHTRQRMYMLATLHQRRLQYQLDIEQRDGPLYRRICQQWQLRPLNVDSDIYYQEDELPTITKQHNLQPSDRYETYWNKWARTAFDTVAVTGESKVSQREQRELLAIIKQQHHDFQWCELSEHRKYQMKNTRDNQRYYTGGLWRRIAMKLVTDNYWPQGHMYYDRNRFIPVFKRSMGWQLRQPEPSTPNDYPSVVGRNSCWTEEPVLVSSKLKLNRNIDAPIQKEKSKPGWVQDMIDRRNEQEYDEDGDLDDFPDMTPIIDMTPEEREHANAMMDVDEGKINFHHCFHFVYRLTSIMSTIRLISYTQP